MESWLLQGKVSGVLGGEMKCGKWGIVMCKGMFRKAKMRFRVDSVY